MLRIHACNIKCFRIAVQRRRLQKEAILFFARFSFDYFPNVYIFHNARELCVTSGRK